MWTPTTRQQHSRPVKRYQTDLTDAEWRARTPGDGPVGPMTALLSFLTDYWWEGPVALQTCSGRLQ
jgi:hypothetical protein